jgi:hypothetical protein
MLAPEDSVKIGGVLISCSLIKKRWNPGLNQLWSADSIRLVKWVLHMFQGFVGSNVFFWDIQLVCG